MRRLWTAQLRPKYRPMGVPTQFLADTVSLELVPTRSLVPTEQQESGLQLDHKHRRMRPNSILTYSLSVPNSVPRRNGSSRRLAVYLTQLNHKERLVLSFFLAEIRDELYQCSTVVEFANSITSCKTLEVEKLEST